MPGPVSASAAVLPPYTTEWPSIQGPQTLLFDADDTLWENNILFERAINRFIDLVAHPSQTAPELRAAFNHLEHARVQVHGYGTRSFHASMLAAFEQFTGRPCTAQQQTQIAGFVDSITTAPVELLPGTAETLHALAQHHRLVLVTKGDPEEQVGKLDRSGLKPLFHHVEVVREKHRQMYLDLRSHHRYDAQTTWMIGNSPRSDINPAIAAGLHAVFVPHPNTWVLEEEPLQTAPAGQHLLMVQRFSMLRNIFSTTA